MTSLSKGSRGAEVKTLQLLLNVAADGIFGAITEEAVKDFQRSKGLTPDGIVGPKTWSALGAGQQKRNVSRIIVHCSATTEGKDFTVADIRRWHLDRGFNDIGYHWVIYRDGTIHKGRDESVVGAHCTGYNTGSVGVCYIGGLAADGKTPKDTRTPMQKAALLALIKELKTRYHGATVHGHREFANKACPCFDAGTEYKNT